MDFKKLSAVSLALALVGLILIYLFYPNQAPIKRSISEVNRYCYGTVQVEGVVTKISQSSSGSLVAELTQNKSSIMVILKEFIQEGDQIFLSGKASKFSNQCWIFSDRVELR